jgi:hypothetical protein
MIGTFEASPRIPFKIRVVATVSSSGSITITTTREVWTWLSMSLGGTPNADSEFWLWPRPADSGEWISGG